MAGGPSCYLYLSFLLHFAGFSSLLAGYCTPYWTVLSVSTGDIHFLGLIVSCFRKGCEVLHVTRARTMLVIVFGLCTATVVLAMFIMQAFCLAIYNGSCRARNVGTGFSYLSFLIALSLGATLALYQMDLAEEIKPDVTSFKIGWSRYSVIGSSGAFLLGSLLNIADYVRRNRLHRRHLDRKAQARDKMIAMMEKNRQGQGNPRPPAGPLGPRAPGQGGAGGGSGGGGNFEGKRLSMTVDAAMQMATAQKRLEKSLNSSQNTSNSRSKRDVILVSEAASKVDTSGARITGGQRGSQRDGGGERLASEATRKFKLTKTGHVDSVEGRQNLPSVKEESDGGDEKSMRRQMTRPRISDNGNGQGPSDGIARTCNLDKTRASERPPRVNGEGGDSSSKYMVAPDIRNPGSYVTDKGKAQTTAKSTESALNDKKGRRGSAVEDALFSVSHLLDNTARLGLPSTVPKETVEPSTKDHKGEKNSTISLDRSKELPAVSNIRQPATQGSLETAKSNVTKPRRTDSERENAIFFTKEETFRSRNTQDSLDTVKEISGKSETRTSDAIGQTSNPQEPKVTKQLSEEQIKRNQIVENMIKNREKRKKRITQ